MTSRRLGRATSAAGRSGPEAMQQWAGFDAYSLASLKVRSTPSAASTLSPACRPAHRANCPLALRGVPSARMRRLPRSSTDAQPLLPWDRRAAGALRVRYPFASCAPGGSPPIGTTSDGTTSTMCCPDGVAIGPHGPIALNAGRTPRGPLVHRPQFSGSGRGAACAAHRG